MLGVSLPYVTIPVRPGRNLAGIVEIAAMKNRQAFFGYNAAPGVCRPRRPPDRRAEPSGGAQDDN